MMASIVVMEEKIRETVLRILASELEDYEKSRKEINDKDRQRWADTISKLASVLKKLEIGAEDEEADEDLAKILSSLKNPQIGLKTLSIIEDCEDRLRSVKRSAARAYALIVAILTHHSLDDSVMGLLFEAREELESILCEVNV